MTPFFRATVTFALVFFFGWAAAAVAMPKQDQIHPDIAEMGFLENKGQTNSSIRYYSSSANASFGFLDDRVLVSYRSRTVEFPKEANLGLQFLGSKLQIPTGKKRTTTVANFLKGNGDSVTNVGLFEEIAYENAYPGIDIVFKLSGRDLKYDLVLAPGSSLESVIVQVDGIQSTSLVNSSQLKFVTALGGIFHENLTAFDEDGTAVDCQFQLLNNFRFGISCPRWNRTRGLRIDPSFNSTYIGGSGRDRASAISTGQDGSVYVAGITLSPNFAPVPGTSDFSTDAAAAVFVAKLSADLSTVSYISFLGGSAMVSHDTVSGLVVDDSSNVYISGTAFSSNFPTTAGAFDTSFGFGFADGYVAKLGPTGDAIVFSTFLGGGNADFAHGIALSGDGHLLVVGHTLSGDFPTTPGVLDATPAFGGFLPVFMPFVSKLSRDGTNLIYSTFLGHAGPAYAVGSDSDGNAYVTGGAYGGMMFPTTTGAFDTTENGFMDAFVSKINPNGTALVYSTLLGGNGGEIGYGIAVADGKAYVTGYTSSTNFPTTANGFLEELAGERDAFVVRLNKTGSALEYASYLGGSGSDIGLGISVKGGHAYVTGGTGSPDFPSVNDSFGYSGGVSDTTPPLSEPKLGFIGWTKSAMGDAFFTDLFLTSYGPNVSAFFGGTKADLATSIALAPAGVSDAYIAGATNSTYLPMAGPFDASFNGGDYDGFVARMYYEPRRGVIGSSTFEWDHLGDLPFCIQWGGWDGPFGQGRPMKCSPQIDICPVCVFGLQFSQAPIVISDDWARIRNTTQMILAGSLKDNQTYLDLLMQDLGKAPDSKYLTKNLRQKLGAAAKKPAATVALSGALLEVLNAIDLDVRKISDGEVTYQKGSDVKVNFGDFARIRISSAVQEGKVKLNVTAGVPAVPHGHFLTWPLVSYTVTGAPMKDGKNTMEIALPIKGISARQPEKLRLLKWDGKTYSDITTAINLARGVIKGQTTEHGLFVVVERKLDSKLIQGAKN